VEAELKAKQAALEQAEAAVAQMKAQADADRQLREEALRAQLEEQAKAHAEAAAARSAAEARAMELEKALEEARNAASRQDKRLATVEAQLETESHSSRNTDAEVEVHAQVDVEAAQPAGNKDSTLQADDAADEPPVRTEDPAQIRAQAEQIRKKLESALKEARMDQDRALELTHRALRKTAKR
jgi:hypothetical protein